MQLYFLLSTDLVAYDACTLLMCAANEPRK